MELASRNASPSGRQTRSRSRGLGVGALALGLVAAHGIDSADRLMTEVKVKRTGLVGGEIPRVLPGAPARAVSAWDPITPSVIDVAV